MKKIIALLMLAVSLPAAAQTAGIKVDIDRTIGEIDPKIYGVFMEPIEFSGRRMGMPDSARFNTLYGSLYDPSSPLADENGFRRDYIEAMRELKVTNMRWPGGNFVMGYDWQDGIGPKSQRPGRINLAWGGIDNNHVGTDEWVQLNRAIGSENVVCVNLGLAGIKDAAGWVEYCNFPKGTQYSDIRIRNGNIKPYGVKIWDLGNEVDGAPWELGHKNPDDYVKIGREAAKAMRSVDRDIRFVASGSSYYESTGIWVDWNRTVLEGLGDMIDYISIHRYWENSPDYYTFIGQSAMDFEEKIRIPAAQIETARAMKGFRNPIAISFDEWGTFGRDFRSVLPVAQCLNAFIRHADVVKMANFTMLTSLLGSDREKGTFKSPLFHAFKLFSNNCLGVSLVAAVQCDTFNTDKVKGIPYLDVTSVYSKEKAAVIVNVVNRHRDRAISAEIVNQSGTLTGKAEARILTADSLDDPFVYDKREQYKPVVRALRVSGNAISVSFPPHSITQIEAGVKP
jgi:alpha-L-arabinofuranosidase